MIMHHNDIEMYYNAMRIIIYYDPDKKRDICQWVTSNDEASRYLTL